MSRTYYVAGVPFSDELFHHGVKGQKWGVRRSREELGYDTSRMNAVQRRLVKNYAKYMKKYDKAQSKVQRLNMRGKNPSKYVDRAKGFLSSATMTKRMASTYSSLSKYEQKKINRGYRQIRRRMRNTTANAVGTINPIGTGRMMGDTYLKSELLSRVSK